MSLKETLQVKAEETQLSKPQNDLKSLIMSMSKEIEKALPEHIKPDRIARIALTTLRQNPKLELCSKESFLGGLMTAAQLGLELNTPLGQAYLIPFNNRRNINGQWQSVTEAQFILGYQGLIDLAYRTGLFRAIYAHVVDEADEFSYCYGLNKDMIHKPNDENTSDKPKFYYGVYHLTNGGFDFKVWRQAKMLKFKNEHALAKSENSPWNSDFESMALKTILKQTLKYAPKSVEMTRYLAQDETIKEEILPDMTESPNIINVEVLS